MAIGKMRGGGCKATPQRMAVLAALAEERHQSLEEIHARCPEVGLVTVYRTLYLLNKLGMVRRLDLGDGLLFTRRFHHMILVSIAVGALLAFIGIYLSYYLDVAFGAAIMLVATVLFFFALAITGRAHKLSGVS